MKCPVCDKPVLKINTAVNYFVGNCPTPTRFENVCVTCYLWTGNYF